MKKIMNYTSLFLLAGTVMVSSCKKTSDPTPDADPTAAIVTSTMTTTNMGNTLEANVIDTVSTGDGNIKLRLNVSGNNNLDHIYILKSEDNGLFTPVIVSTITNSYGTFSGGSTDNYSLNIPNLSSFIVDILLPVRTTSAAVTDVYKIWITNGSGGFTKPAKNRDLGIAVVTLKYVASAPSATFVTATLNLGSQSAVPASLLVTSGQISVLNTADYNDSPSSGDLRLTTMTSGQKDNGSTAAWLYSPAAVPTGATYDGSPVFTVPAGSNTTYIAAYSGSTSFDNVTAADLTGLSVGTGTSIQVTAGGVYMFKTSASPSKIGVLKVNSLTTETDTDKGVIANVTVKVLN